MHCGARIPAFRALFTQAEADGGKRRTFCAVRRAAARTEHRHQRLVRLAARGAVALRNPQAGSTGITLVAFFTLVAFAAGSALRSLGSLRTLRSRLSLRSGRSRGTLRARLSLGASDPLNTLRARQTVGPRRAPLAFRPGIPAASGKDKRNSNKQNGENSHDDSHGE